MANISNRDYIDNYKISGSLGAFGTKNIIVSSNTTVVNVNKALSPSYFEKNNSIDTNGLNTIVRMATKSVLTVSNAKHNAKQDLEQTKTITLANTVKNNNYIPYRPFVIAERKHTNNEDLNLIKTLSESNMLSVATCITTINVKPAAMKTYEPIVNDIYFSLKYRPTIYVTKKVKELPPTTIANKSKSLFIYLCPYNTLATIRNGIYDSNITKLTDEEFFFDIKLRENIYNGFDDIGINIVSGKHCEIKLNNTNGINIASIDNLPSSLKYDAERKTIYGIPFLVGNYQTKITLDNGKIVTMNFKIIPISMSIGL